MPLFAGGKWVTARLAACFAFPACSALSYVCCNLLSRSRSVSWLKPWQKFPSRVKTRQTEPSWSVLLTCVAHWKTSLKWSIQMFSGWTSPLFALKASKQGELFISSLSCYLYKGTADGALYIFITTPLPTPTHYLTPKGLLWSELAFLLHLVLYSWSVDELSVKCFAELQLCRSFAGSFDSLLSFLRGIPLSIRGSVPPTECCWWFQL